MTHHAAVVARGNAAYVANKSLKLNYVLLVRNRKYVDV